MKIYQILYIVPFVLISSCTKSIELINPNENRKPAVRCVLQNDSIFKLDLYLSNKTLTSNNTFDLITDANIEIADNYGNIENLEFSGGNKMIDGISNGYYSSLNLVDFSKEYTLNITHEKFENLSSETEFPKPPNVSNIITEDIVNKENNYSSKIRFTLNDNFNSNQYYNVYIDFELDFYQYIDEGYISVITYKNIKAYLSRQGNNYFPFEIESNTLFSDVVFNNSSIPIEYIIHFGGFVGDSVTINNVYLNVETLEESYFNYLVSVEKQKNQDDVFSEAVFINSNIKNGLGYFGSKNKLRYKLDF